MKGGIAKLRGNGCLETLKERGRTILESEIVSGLDYVLGPFQDALSSCCMYQRLS